MGKRERMSSVDTAWLRMDSQANLMLIVGVYEFEGKVDYDRLRRLVEEKLLQHDRFRSCVVQDATGYSWEVDDNFDLDLHLARTALPGAAVPRISSGWSVAWLPPRWMRAGRCGKCTSSTITTAARR